MLYWRMSAKAKISCLHSTLCSPPGKQDSGMKKQRPYQVIPFPRIRRVIVDGGRIGARRHMIHGLIEVDVTSARQIIREHQARTGETLSFTAFIITCLGHAVEQNRHIHAYRTWRNQLILFNEVDVNTMFAPQTADQKVHLAHIIKAVNKRTFRDIHEEIRGFQARQASSLELKAFRLLGALPGFLRRLLYWTVLKNPQLVKKSFGTVAVSAVGMFGKGSGWAIPIANHTLAITIGGIAQKPGVVEGQIAIREYLSLTISFDHDIVDGAPAARFAQQFKELIESAYGLSDIAASEERAALAAQR
jgi:pyruvate/2-oxoglutarate dehydrogenase complex dihydrolipoamide acyltransferase (E2) component